MLNYEQKSKVEVQTQYHFHAPFLKIYEAKCGALVINGHSEKKSSFITKCALKKGKQRCTESFIMQRLSAEAKVCSCSAVINSKLPACVFMKQRGSDDTDPQGQQRKENIEAAMFCFIFIFQKAVFPQQCLNSRSRT